MGQAGSLSPGCLPALMNYTWNCLSKHAVLCNIVLEHPSLAAGSDCVPPYQLDHRVRQLTIPCRTSISGVSQSYCPSTVPSCLWSKLCRLCLSHPSSQWIGGDHLKSTRTNAGSSPNPSILVDLLSLICHPDFEDSASGQWLGPKDVACYPSSS